MQQELYNNPFSEPINLINNRELGYLNEIEEHYKISIDELPQNVGEILNI